MKNLFFLFVLFALIGCGENKSAQAIDLTCEFVATPLGIDQSNLRFNWTIRTSENNFSQKAYRLRIASSVEMLEADKADVFDSEKKGSTHMSASIDLPELKSYTRYYWDVTVFDSWGMPCVVSAPSWFETAKLQGKESWAATWISDANNKEYRPAPLFRKKFNLKDKPVSARAYVSGLGYCTFYLNGSKVGNGALDPGFTDYSKRVLYMTYDITSQLQTGSNLVAAELGNGWFNNQTPTVWKFNLAPWRARPQLLCEIHVTYDDGSKEVFASDNSWKTSTGGLLYDNLYVGSTYDARKEPTGWNQLGYDDSKWVAVTEVASPASLIESQLMQEVGISRTFKPKAVKELGKNSYLCEMGENIAGVVRIKVSGSAGTKVTILYGELLNAEGRLDQSNINMHLRGEFADEKEVQRDIYILKGEGVEEYTPPYTYHGFQYAEITADAPIRVEGDWVEGVVMHSLVDEIGDFSCSDELLNTIYDNCKRSYLANLFGIPTDCPHREKNGWMADGYMVQEAGMLNYDSRNIYSKWVNDIVDGQAPDGNVPGIVPTSWNWDSNWAGPLWDAAIFITPDLLYKHYGDTRPFEIIYPVAQRYLAYLDTCRNDNGLLYRGLGDWLYYKAITPVDFMTTLFYYQDCMTMAKMSKLLGKKEEEKYLAKAAELKHLVNSHFFHSDSAYYANKTQLSYALPLYMGVVPEELELKVAENLANAIRANDYSLDFGFIGSMVIPQVLSDYGYNDVMYRLATKTTMPSYGYWVKQWNATSLFETWDITRRIGDASLNHPSMGAISAWMMKSLAGINIANDAVAFEKITIKPTFIDQLTFARASHKSVSGVVSSEWKRVGSTIELRVVIPANCTADIVLPTETKKVGSGVHQFTI